MAEDNEEIVEYSMNYAAVELIDEMTEMLELIKGSFFETESTSEIMDLGCKVEGGFLAGEYLTQICMGGLAEVSIKLNSFNDKITMPVITVTTDCPVKATMGSQYAGWAIDKGGYTAMASGPARILAKKPSELYDKLNLAEEHDQAVVVLEANKYPPDGIIRYMAKKCNVELSEFIVVIAPTASVAGATQISGRSIETALHKLYDLGMDITTIISAIGSAPIAPVKLNENELMLGRTNDMLIYGSDVYLQVKYPDDSELKSFLEQAISEKSTCYGKLFYDIVKEVNGDFYKIDSSIFAPAKLTVNNLSTGKTHSYGRINVDMLQKSIL
ncbi:MAG: methenyltetrahydromethanopterin cyclohydrolase [Asgard group archaeon]|nr:methenyltetrahydromethanopterin cyclohydrolase [Asgard group archaeon]